MKKKSASKKKSGVKKPVKKVVSIKSKNRKRKIVEKATRVKLNKEIVHETNPNQAA